MFKQLKLPFAGVKKPQPHNESSDEYQPEDDERKPEANSLCFPDFRMAFPTGN